MNSPPKSHFALRFHMCQELSFNTTTLGPSGVQFRGESAREAPGCLTALNLSTCAVCRVAVHGGSSLCDWECLGLHLSPPADPLLLSLPRHRPFLPTGLIAPSNYASFCVASLPTLLTDCKRHTRRRCVFSLVTVTPLYTLRALSAIPPSRDGLQSY